MFLSLITLATISAAINYASSCASLGWQTREYSDWEKDWCRADFHRCARHLCQVNNHPCDDYLIENTIIPEIRCKLSNQCYPRTDMLGQYCRRNDDCRNSNYRCRGNRCVHKSTVSIPFPNGRRCYNRNSECPDKMRCDKSIGLCVPKRDRCDATPDCDRGYTCMDFRCVYTAGKGGSGGGSRGRCAATPDCAPDYTCVNFRCVYTAGKGVTLSGGSGGSGGGSRDRCAATPDCAPDFTCKDFRCVYTAGKGIKLSGGSGGRGGRRKRCDQRDRECQDSRLKCDRARGKCVPKDRRNGKPYRQGKSCRFSPDCGADYMCYNGDCVLGKLS